MDIKTVLFSPLNSTGHINALLAIADRLKEDHGYRTVFLLMGPTTLRTIEERGHELLVINQETGQLEWWEDRYAKQNDWNEAVQKMHKLIRMEPIDMAQATIHGRESFGYLCKEQWARNHHSYARLIDVIQPDLILLDTWTVPPCILALKHTPWVYVCSCNPFSFLASKLAGGIKPPRMAGARLFSKEERERLRQEEPPNRWLALLDEWKRLSLRVETKQPHEEHQAFNKLYRDHGFEPIEPSHHSPHLNLYMCPLETDYSREDDLFEYPRRWFRYDHMIRKPTDQVNLEQREYWAQRLEEAMRGKNEMIYFSLGTLASGDLELMRHYLDMFREDKERLYVISKGPRGDQITLSRDNMIGANYLPQTLFLERANLAIIHGGNNSTTECLYYGVPMIVLPCFGDQPDNAQRMEDLKLGKRLSIHRCAREEMMAAVGELLGDQELIERVRQIGKSMRARDDAKKVSLMLKKLVEEKELDESFIDHCRDNHIDHCIA